MAKLICKNKTILNNMKYATSIFDIGRGLTFASKKKIENGICLVMPTKSDKQKLSAVTMLFCFYSYDILFVNSEFKIVDKTTLKPFKLSYTPKAPCKYVIESTENKFKNIKIGDTIQITKD